MKKKNILLHKKSNSKGEVEKNPKCCLFIRYVGERILVQCSVPKKTSALSMHIVNFPSKGAPILCKHTCIC